MGTEKDKIEMERQDSDDRTQPLPAARALLQMNGAHRSKGLHNGLRPLILNGSKPSSSSSSPRGSKASLYRMAAKRAKQQFNQKQLDKLSSFSSVTYLPSNSALYREWLRDHPQRLSWDRWLVFFLIGVVVGLWAVLLRQCMEFLSSVKWFKAREFAQANNLGLCFAWTVSISCVYVIISSVLVTFIHPPARGSGVPEVIAYLNGIVVHDTLRLKTLLVKFASNLFAVSSGLVCAIQGPVIAMSAICGSGIGQLKSRSLGINLKCFSRFRNPEDRRNFTTAGVASGVAAAFQAPIGGLMFAMEDISSFMTRKLSWQGFFCCGIAAFTSAMINAPLSAFRTTEKFGLFGLWIVEPFQVHILVFIPAIVLGVVGGILGAVFTRLNVLVRSLREKFIDRFRKPSAKKLLLILETIILVVLMESFVVFSPLGFPCHNYTSLPPEIQRQLDACGTGFNISTEPWHCEVHSNDTYNEIATLLVGTASSTLQNLGSRNTHARFGYKALLTILPVYFVMMVWTAGSAIAGGVFVPTMIVGGLIGRVVGLGLYDIYVTIDPNFVHKINVLWLDPGAFAIIGASSMLGGVTRLCLAVTIIIVEMSHHIDMILPVMVSVFVAKLMADAVCKSMYKYLLDMKSMPYLESEPVVAVGDHTIQLDMYRASDIMCSPVSTIYTTETVATLAKLLVETNHGGFPVIKYDEETRQEHFYGFISRNDLIVILSCDEVYEEQRVDTVLDPKINYQEVSLDYVPNYKAKMERVHMYTKFVQYYKIYINLERFINISAPKVDEDYSLLRTYELFRSLGMRHLVVVDANNRVVGIITRKDLMAYNIQQKVQGLQEDDDDDEVFETDIEDNDENDGDYVVLPAITVSRAVAKDQTEPQTPPPGTLGPASLLTKHVGSFRISPSNTPPRSVSNTPRGSLTHVPRGLLSGSLKHKTQETQL